MFDKTIEYIHQNPVSAGFINKQEDWKYSSARDFCNSESNPTISLIELSYS